MWCASIPAAFQNQQFFRQGGLQNNFLIELELQLERENDFLAGMYSENQLVFKRIIDSLKEENAYCGNNWIVLMRKPLLLKTSPVLPTFILMLRLERYALLRVPNGMQRKTVCFLTLEVFRLQRQRFILF